MGTFLLAVFGMQAIIRPAVEKPIGGPWSLIDTSGKPVTERVFAGHYTLLYFGYTHCPDVCPLTLATVAAALDTLGPRGELVQPIFISVDPQRDTPQAIRDYVGHFSPRIVGLTGPPKKIAAVTKEFRVESDIQMPMPSDPAMYRVNHTSVLFLMDGRNHLVHMFSTNATAKEIARYLSQILPHS